MKQDQKSAFLRMMTNNRGQAVVEYILLAVVVISIILSAKKMFKTLDDGINSYIGGYISCLMEYGELPSLGVKDNNLQKHVAGTGKKCEAKFEEFSFAEGRPPVGGSNSGSTNGGSGSGSGSNRSSNAAGGSGSGKGSGSGNGSGNGTGDGDGDGDGDGNSAAAGLTRGGSGGRGDKRVVPSVTNGGYATADSVTDADASKVKVIEEEEEESSSNRDKNGRRRLGGTFGQAEQYRAITGRMKQEFEKQQKRKPTPRTPTTTVKKISDEATTRITIKKNIERGPASKEIQQKSNTDGFTFGNIMRWLMIAAMVIAIFIFFGGQIMNYSNSKD